jgi:hypothetical protein
LRSLGLFTLELSAVGLPLAIHFWTAPGVHRIAALAFYFVDLALLAGNAVLDFRLNAGEALTQPMRLYLDFIAPATPLVVGLMWSVLFILDPANRIRDWRWSWPRRRVRRWLRESPRRQRRRM